GRARPAGAGRGGRRRHAAVGPEPGRRPAPGDHGRRAAHRRLREHGLRGRRGPRGRRRVVQLRRPELPARPPGAGDVRHHVRGRARRQRALRRGPAHPHLAGADPGHADPAAAAVRGQPRQVLPHRHPGRHPQPGVPPDRVPGRGRGPDHGRPAGRDPRLRGRHVRRGAADPAAAGLLPVHRAVRRRVHGVPRLPRRLHQAGRRALPGVPVPGLDRDRRLRDGQPARAGRLRHRPGPVQRVRVRPGHRALADDQGRRDRHPRHPRGRRPVQPGIRIGGVMRIPLSWLLEYAAIGSGGVDGVDADDVARRLTACGLEIESVERVGYDIKGVVVAEVLDVEELTGFKKPVRYCQVSTGDGQERHVICGATNFVAGDRVPLALPGATLPGGFEIGARKTYGKISEGMICSAAELALGDDHSGIMVLAPDAPLGTEFVTYGGLRDFVMDVNVTPDKGYALSVRGVARELAISYGVAYTDPADTGLPPYVGRVSDEVWPASIEDPTACDRFVLREVRGIDPAATTPLRMQVRLARAGQRSVSLAVDVTNYLMLELGQPLHAFDRERLTGPIVVRRARPGERLETLDHVVRDLDPEDILITDSSGPISLAGTMGGLATEVTDTSRDLVIEAAHFSARGTARMSRRHKLGSEASARFERGVDHELQQRASAKAVAMLSDLAGGLVIEGCSYASAPIPEVSIVMAADYPDQVAGMVYGLGTVIRRLEQVSCQVTQS